MMQYAILLLLALSACGYHKDIDNEPADEPLEGYKQLQINDDTDHVLLPYVELSEGEAGRVSLTEEELLKEMEIEGLEAAPIPEQPVSLRPKMSPVRNQKYRPSCTAFAAVAMFEYYHPGKDFSEQCLVKFSSNYDAGYMPNRLTYAINNGLYNERDCPYQINPSGRNTIPDLRRAARTWPSDGFTYMSTAESSQIAFIRERLRAGHPVSIAIFVAGKGWQKTGELLRAPTQEDLNADCVKTAKGMKCGAHAVIVTGYGEQDHVGYLEFKNSWGDSWGNRGYGKMAYSYFAKMRLAEVIAK